MKPIKRLLIICLVFTATTSIFSKSKPKVALAVSAYQQEYNQLLTQCVLFKAQFLKEFSFEKIKAQVLQGFNQEFLPKMKERFTTQEGDQRSSGYLNMIGVAAKGLEIDLAAKEACYNIQLSNSLINYISASLINIGSIAALKLLSDLTTSDFFLNLN